MKHNFFHFLAVAYIALDFLFLSIAVHILFDVSVDFVDRLEWIQPYMIAHMFGALLTLDLIYEDLSRREFELSWLAKTIGMVCSILMAPFVFAIYYFGIVLPAEWKKFQTGDSYEPRSAGDA